MGFCAPPSLETLEVIKGDQRPLSTFNALFTSPSTSWPKSILFGANDHFHYNYHSFQHFVFICISKHHYMSPQSKSTSSISLFILLNLILLSCCAKGDQAENLLIAFFCKIDFSFSNLGTLVSTIKQILIKIKKGCLNWPVYDVIPVLLNAKHCFQIS